MPRLASNRRPDSRLSALIFLVACALALLALGVGTAFAGEEEGGGSAPVDPVVVPEAEAPPTTNPTTTPTQPTTSSSTSAPPPVSAPVESTSTGTVKHTSTPTSSGGSSGGSKTTSTPTNHGSSVGSSGGSNSGGSSNHSGGDSTSAAPAGTSSPQSTSGFDESGATAGETATAAGGAHLAATAGKSRDSQPTGQQDEAAATGAAGLGASVKVEKPKHQSSPLSNFVPLPGKNKLPFLLLILGVTAVASFVVWTQFRVPRKLPLGPRRARRVPTATAVPPAPNRLRAHQWAGEQERRARPARRKAA